ncbi:MAG: AAA family ATPase [Brevundimonas sp.]|nr:AAA family ATPase [Brevundimonas sp.]
MKIEDKDATFSALFAAVKPGELHIVTGKNGTGKSRFFQQSTLEAIDEVKSTHSRYARLICMSGTMHDKYPREVYMSGNEPGRPIVYLGNKVNNNMISDISPFRTLAVFMLNPGNNAYKHIQLIGDLLGGIGFETKFTFRFRFGKGKKSAAAQEVSRDFEVDLNDMQKFTDEAPNVLAHILDGNLILSDFELERKGKRYSLIDLSSGEKQYILALLGVSFCAAPDSIIFFDEPENSMHPAWQLRISKDISTAMQQIHGGATMLIATHSPLIASASTDESFFICDFPEQKMWERVKLFGRNSDSVLRERFHLISARSPEVTELIGDCLRSISSGETDTQTFLSLQERLRSMELSLDDRDPLTNTVKTILSI